MKTCMPEANRRGFTLIEVLLVVAILGILATIVAVKTIGQTDKAKRQAAWTQATSIKTAIAQFEMEASEAYLAAKRKLHPFWEEKTI